MRSLLPLLLLFSACALQGAPLKAAGYSFKEKTLEQYADPGFKKLTDGDKKRNAVIWHDRQFGGWPVTIDFHFGSPVKIAAVKAHIYRGIRTYGIRDIKVFGKNSSGKYIPLGAVSLKQPYTRPKNEPANSMVLIPSGDDTPVAEVRIILSGTGHLLGLNEIEFEGTAPPVKKIRLAANPMEKFISTARPGLRLFKDGKLFVLENDRSIYVIDPFYSGAVNFAYDKVAKRNFIRYAPAGHSFGPAFDDRLWGGTANKFLYKNREYKVTVLADTAEKKQIKLSGTGSTGAFAAVTIDKTYTLEKDSSLLRVDFSISNSIENVVPLNSGYWMSAGVVAPEGYLRLAPGFNCVETVQSSVKEFSTEDLSSSWFGAFSKGTGIAFIAPYELLKAVYFWSDNPLYGTAECKLGIYPINAGSSLDFSMFLAPFSGVEIPDKVTGFAAGSFDLAGDYASAPRSGKVRFRFFKEGNYTLRLSCASVQKGKTVFKEFLKQALKKGTFAELPFKIPSRWGTVVFKAEILEGKVCRFAMEKVVVFSRSTGLYNLTPDGEKRPDSSGAGAKLDLDFNSRKVAPQKMIPWGTPLGAAKKPKVLAVNLVNGGIRDMIDLSCRFDMDLTTNFIAGMWSLSRHCQALNIKTCINELGKKLKKRYDCIVISANVWQYLDKNTAAALLSQVEQGTGLIVTSPERYPEALAQVFTKEKGKFIKSRWQKGREYSPVTAGIPFGAIPESLVYPYSSKGKVLVQGGKLPLLVESRYGKGKVFLFTYGVRRPWARGGKYNPAGSYHLPHMSFDPPKAAWDYHEYIMALWGRVLYSASGVETGVTCVSFGLQDFRGGLQLRSALDTPAELTVTLRNRYSEVMSSSVIRTTLKKGINKIPLVLPKDDYTGLHIADAILRKDGKVLWFGGATFSTPGAGKFLSVKVPQKIWQPREKAAVTSAVSGKGKVIHRLYDIWGNEVERLEGVSVNVPLANCRSKAAFLHSELVSGNKVIDKVITRIAIHGAPDPRVFSVMQGWPSLSGCAQNWNLDLYVKQLRKFGFNLAGGGASFRGPVIAEEALRNNNILYGSTQYDYALGGPRPMKNIAARNKEQMIRIPCLSKPGFKEKLEKRPGRFGPTWKYGVLDVQGPDESNMFGDWDGCFSEDCMREFRKWLKTQYPTLAALNKAWATAFKSWDEVSPSTSAEARKMSSFASWMDHRTFNDWNRADALRALVAGINAKDASLTYSLSGTQNTNPWNAWDYWQMMPSLKALSGYGGEQTVQHRSFSNGSVRNAGWVGYDGDLASQAHGIYQGLLNGSTGISIYGNFNIDPSYNISERGKDLICAIDRFRNGPAELLMRSTFVSSPVALHYSPASNKSAWFTGFGAVQSGNIKGFNLTLSDNGVPYDYVAYAQLEQGKVPDKYKVVILPCSTSLSDKEIAALRRFVKEGGTLIADFMAGLYDNHGVKRSKAALLDLFGLKKYGKVQRAEAPLIWNGASAKVAWVEKGVAASTAKAQGRVGEQAVCFVNSYGKGKAIYLGTSIMTTFGDWQEMRYSKSNAAMTGAVNSFTGEVLKRHKIIPVATAPDMPSALLAARRNKETFLLGIYRAPASVSTLAKEAVNHKVKLFKKFHIYDVFAGKYLGYGNEFTVSFAPHTQGLYALMPFKAGKLNVKVSRKGRMVNMDVSLERKGKDLCGHVFRVELFDSKGKASEAFSTLLHASENQAGYTFQLPLNKELKGWSAVVTDVITGTKAKVKF